MNVNSLDIPSEVLGECEFTGSLKYNPVIYENYSSLCVCVHMCVCGEPA